MDMQLLATQEGSGQALLATQESSEQALLAAGEGSRQPLLATPHSEAGLQTPEEVLIVCGMTKMQEN